VRGADNDNPDSPIEAYLDELVLGTSTRRPRHLRHLIAEAEAHLRDDAARGVAAGRSHQEAEADAVTRFGPARDLLAAEQRQLATPLAMVARQFVSTALILGAVGALAVGLSGFLAEVVRLVGGSRFLVDVAPGRVLSASDCARWLAADPGARSCHDAAIADWVDEVVGYRLIVGLLGAAALAVFILLRKRWLRQRRWATLPGEVTNTIAVTLFGVAGLWTLGMGIDAMLVSAGNGSGQWLSAAPVALAAAVLFGIRLVRDIRNPSNTESVGRPTREFS